jgi:hypothetical protein
MYKFVTLSSPLPFKLICLYLLEKKGVSECDEQNAEEGEDDEGAHGRNGKMRTRRACRKQSGMLSLLFSKANIIEKRAGH